MEKGVCMIARLRATPHVFDLAGSTGKARHIFSDGRMLFSVTWTNSPVGFTHLNPGLASMREILAGFETPRPISRAQPIGSSRDNEDQEGIGIRCVLLPIPRPGQQLHHQTMTSLG